MCPRQKVNYRIKFYYDFRFQGKRKFFRNQSSFIALLEKLNAYMKELDNIKFEFSIEELTTQVATLKTEKCSSLNYHKNAIK